MNITVDQIMKWNPCGRWPRERIEKMMGGAPVSLERILVAPDIPRSDRIWVACYVFPETIQVWINRADTYATEAEESTELTQDYKEAAENAAIDAAECADNFSWFPGARAYAAHLYALDAARYVRGWKGWGKELEAQLAILIQLAKERK